MRIYSTKLTTTGSKDDEKERGTVEIRYVKNAEEALAVYACLYDKLTEPPSSYRKVSTLAVQNVGSKRFQEVCWGSKKT